MRLEALILDLDGSIVARCMVINISVTGAKLILPASTEVPDCFVLVLSKKGGVRRQCEVTWRSEASIGVRFVSSVAAEGQEVSFISDMLTRISSRN